MDAFSHFRSVSERRTGVLMWQIASPFILILGTFGNVSALIVFSSKRFRAIPSTIYFIGLAVSDLAFLHIGLMRQWFLYSFDIDVRSFHPVLCKLHIWLVYSIADTIVWILTAMTIERLLAIYLPFKVKNICTTMSASVTILVIVIAACLINAHLLYGFGELDIKTVNGSIFIPCAPMTKEYQYFFGKIWTWIDICKFSLIPFAALTLGNVCIIYKRLKMYKQTKSRVRPENTNRMTALRQNNRLSALLVAINFLFIFSTLPVCVYFIGEPYWIPNDIPRQIQLQDPWWALVNLCMYTGSSINFCLYISTGSRFRASVAAWFLCRQEQNQI